MFRGPLTVLLLRLGVVGILYTLLRFLFWTYNIGFFPSPPALVFVGGVRFDASAIAWINAPWVLFCLVWPAPGKALGRFLHGLFVSTNALGLFFNCVDLGYYAFSLKRSTADVLKIITAGGDALRLAPTFVKDYWHIPLILLTTVAIVAWSYGRIGSMQRDKPQRWPWHVGWRLLAIALLALAGRGGSQLIPLQPLDGVMYGGAHYLPVVLNTPFTILTTLGKPTLQDHQYMPASEADALWPVVQRSVLRDTSVTGILPTEPPNVVVIILESFSALYSGVLSGEESYMPFLDSLMAQSLTYGNAYANGRRSIDGIPAILASLPQWMDEAFITSPYASLPFTSLASILGNAGYSTSFYHGGRNGTMSFDAFAKSAGFQRYIGLDEYENGTVDYDGHWGVRDRPFLQFHARQLAKERQPFLSTVFTLSSHHPYQLPTEEIDRFTGGTQAIHPTLRYTDDALRQFFTTCRTMPWYANTLFVITADHTADLERSGNQGDRPIDYWVPLLFHAPWLKNGMQETVVQHIDIPPTILELIGLQTTYFAFGHSMLDPHRPPYAIWSNNGVFTITGHDQQIQYDGTRILSRIPLGDGHRTAPDEEDGMLRYLQAATQQYNYRLIRGELSLENVAP